MKLSVVLRWVKNSDNFDFFVITRMSSNYLSTNVEGLQRFLKHIFATSSMTRFATTNETEEPIAVPNTCL